MRSTIQSESSRIRCCVTPPSVLIADDGITRCSSDAGRATASGGGGGAAMLPNIDPRGSAGGGGGGATVLLAGVASFGWGGPPRRFKSDMESSPRGKPFQAACCILRKRKA